jgi:TQXA domain-containing protein
MKRFLSFLLTFIMLFSVAVPAFAASTPEEAMNDVRVYSVGDSVSYLNYDGEPKGVTPAYYTTKSITGVVTEYPAYCINPHLPGPSEGGPYSVDTKSYISNPKIWGIITNGYPYKTVGELGVRTQEQAYYATKMALWTYINGWDVSLWTAANGEQNDTLAALKKIYAAGMAVTEITRPMLSATADTPKVTLDSIDPNYASQTYTVTANMEIRSYEVSLDGVIPDGTKIADMNNNPKTVFAAGEKFKVLIPADQISGKTGNFEVIVTGQLRTNAVIYGMSYDTTLQDFSVTRDPFDFQDAKAAVLYSA